MRFIDAWPDFFTQLASERGTATTIELTVGQFASTGADADAIRAAFPDTERDDEYRKAVRCQLDRYESSIGKSGIDFMLDRIESVFERLDTESATFGDLEALGDMSAIDGISQEEKISIMTDCRVMEINMRRKSESGFMDAVQSQIPNMQ